MNVSTDFDGGGGCSVSVDEGTNEIAVSMEDDPGGQSGYFAFRLDDAGGEMVTVNFENVGSYRFPSDGPFHIWDDPNNFRAWEVMEGTDGSITLDVESATQFFSNVPPYPHHGAVDRVNEVDSEYPDLVETEVIGQSQQGRDMHAIRITDPDTPRSEKQDIATLTRQHAGETHGSYHMDAAIDFVLDRFENGSFSEDYVFHFLPDANPDGMVNGWDRSAANGDNLNREWQSDSPTEISNMKAYYESNIEDLRWGIDFHATDDPNYDAAILWNPAYGDDSDSQRIQTMADASLSFPGDVSEKDGSGLSRGYFNQQFGAPANSSESFYYNGYSIEDLQQEAETWITEITKPDIKRLVMSNGRLAVFDGKLVVQS